MKKLAMLTIILAVALGFAAASAHAGKPPKTGAKKVQLHQWAIVEGEEDARGWAIINYTPPEETAAISVTVEIQVRGLLPDHPYVFKSHGETLATFTTNKIGTGHCHANLTTDEALDPAWEINIRDGLDEDRLVLCSTAP